MRGVAGLKRATRGKASLTGRLATAASSAALTGVRRRGPELSEWIRGRGRAGVTRTVWIRLGRDMQLGSLVRQEPV